MNRNWAWDSNTMLPETARPRTNWIEPLLAIALLYVGCIVTLGPTLKFSQWYMPADNQAAVESLAWLDGELSVANRALDMAQYEGRYYNIFPPLWTVVCYAVYSVNRLLFGETLVFWTSLYVLIVAAPIPLLGYLAFRAGRAGPPWAAVLAFYAIAGTGLWPEAVSCKDGWIYSLQHVLSQAGLALLLWDLLGAKRFWIGGLGVLVAAWARQTCIIYALPLVWTAWRSPRHRRTLASACLPLLVTVAVPMGLNYAKFGSPLETGYKYILDDPVNALGADMAGPDGEKHLFAWRYFPQHVYNMWLAPPRRIEMTPVGPVIEGNPGGTALWIATPLTLLIFIEARRWWTDPTRRALMLATVLIMVADLCYHGPTLASVGHNRYALDFILVWLAVIAPWTTGPRRRWFTLACVAWSVVFFYMVTRG